MGTLARYVLDQRMPLEMCLSSNVDTGAAASFEAHPFPLLLRAGFKVFLNTDDRLMSDTEMSKELRIATETYGFTLAEIQKIALNAMKSAFAPHEKRVEVIREILLPQYGGAM